jgi:hypothetical protein
MFRIIQTNIIHLYPYRSKEKQISKDFGFINVANAFSRFVSCSVSKDVII